MLPAYAILLHYCCSEVDPSINMEAYETAARSMQCLVDGPMGAKSIEHQHAGHNVARIIVCLCSMQNYRV